MAPEPTNPQGPSASTNNTNVTNTQSSTPLDGDQSRVSFRVNPIQQFPKHDTVKLTEPTYILWKHQVLLIIDGYGLLDYISAELVPPSRFIVSATGQSVENPDFVIFNQQDKLLTSWLLSTVHADVLPHLTGITSSRAVWSAISRLYGARSSAKISSLRHSLHSQKKGSLTVNEFLAKIKLLCDTLNASGSVITEREQVSVVLAGLSIEFESVLAIASRESLSLEALTDMLLDCEARQKSFFTDSLSMHANMVSHQPNQQGSVQVNLARPQPSVTSQGTVLPQGASNLFQSPVSSQVTQHSSSVPVSSPVQSVSDVVQDQSFADANFNRGQRGGYGFRGRGRGRFNNNRPQCQLCGRVGHVVQKCYYRFDLSYQGLSSDSDVSNQSSDVPRQQSFVSNTSYSHKGVSSPAQAYNHVFQPQSPSVPGFQSSYLPMHSLQSTVYLGASYPGVSPLVFPAVSGGCSSGLQQPFSPVNSGFSAQGSYGPVSPQASLSGVSVASTSASGLVQPASVMNAGFSPAAGQPVSRDMTWYPDSGASHHVTNDVSALQPGCSDQGYSAGREPHT